MLCIPREGDSMERIRMMDIIPLIGLPEPKYGRASYNVPCPCCDDNPKKKHLNIHLEKDVFRCPRCGFAGGVFDLYAHYAGINRKNAREILYARLNLSYGGDWKNLPQRRVLPVQSVQECPITDIDTRHDTYTALLSKLSLASDHRDNLLGRGLSDEIITELGYRTTPAVGTTMLAKQLLSDGHYLAGVPGFYHNTNGEWSFIRESRGIMIPVRSPEGKIQGIQVRRDNLTKRKFRWISSVGKPDGTPAEGWTHLAGTPQEAILLTEGPLKADVIHHLTGYTVLAVPGVNSLSQLKTALEYMREHGTRQVMTAFDMDYLSNPHVQNGYMELTRLLSEMDFHFGTYLWDPQYKGLDDYVWEHCYHQG